MLGWNRLRVESGNGTAGMDYRIRDGQVECRAIDVSSLANGARWRQLSADELRSLVLANPLLAKWLSHRMGVFQLVRACSADSGPENYESQAAA